MPTYGIQSRTPAAPSLFPSVPITARTAAPALDPRVAPPRRAVSASPYIPQVNGVQMPVGNPFNPPPRPPTQDPGNNYTEQGYTEQLFGDIQNRILDDPYSNIRNGQIQGTQTPTAGETQINGSLGSLSGPGAGQQYWNGVSGQFNDPFAGETFARDATAAFGANGPASAFNDQAQGQYQDFTGYTGPQNAQGQFGQTSRELAGGTQGERGLGQIGGQYGDIGQYNGQNNALGQYQQNAQSGPLAGQSYFDSVSGLQGSVGTYSDPNLAAGQYAQTQGAFGDMPIANFDPFYDRARQLATQDYNRQSAGRGVYGSSEALSGVGNVITDIEAQRANRSFDAEMQRAVEQRNRQQLLGEQARMGDLSSVEGFKAGLSGIETFGNLAKTAGEQTLGQQTMLGTQARASDVSATDAFDANLAGAKTFADIYDQQGKLELSRNELLGNQANAADSQALGAQNANIAGLNAFGDIASSADTAETNRFNARTGAMNTADQTGLDRIKTGADIAFRGDENERADFTATNNAARDSGALELDRERLGIDATDRASDDDLGRLSTGMEAAGIAEGDRTGRLKAGDDLIATLSSNVQKALSEGLDGLFDADGKLNENSFNTKMAPELTKQGATAQQIDDIRQTLRDGINVASLGIKSEK